MADLEEDPEVALSRTFSELARDLMTQSDVDATWDRICLVAVETIDGCESAGISLIQGRTVESRATTPDDIPRLLDHIQSETQQGPCVDAIQRHEVFTTGFLPDETRWPDYSQRAFDETGVLSVLSFRLYVQGETLGSLNLYSQQRDAFDDHDVAVGAVFATHAALAMNKVLLTRNLEAKADSRDAIGIAKGMIMAHSQVTDEEAFDLLRRASQRMNVKVRDMAHRMADGGSLGDLI